MRVNFATVFASVFCFVLCANGYAAVAVNSASLYLNTPAREASTVGSALQKVQKNRAFTNRPRQLIHQLWFANYVNKLALRCARNTLHPFYLKWHKTKEVRKHSSQLLFFVW